MINSKLVFGVLLSASIVVGVGLIATNVAQMNESKLQEQEDTTNNEQRVNISVVKGVKFSVPSTWVRDEEKQASQVILYYTLKDYKDDNTDAISITSSWVEKDFRMSDFVNTLYTSWANSKTVASCEMNNYSIGDYKIYEISLINDGVYGSFLYFKKDNVAIELLYATEDIDRKDEYINDVQDIIKSMVFTGDVTKDDFPVPEESSETSKEGVSKVESSEPSYHASLIDNNL